MRADGDRIAEHHRAFENAADVDRYVAAAGQRAAHIDARRIGQGHSGIEQRVRLRALIDPLEHRQVALAVHAQGLVRARRMRRFDRNAVGDGKCDHIGQIIFAAGIPIADSRQPARERCGRRRHDAGVDLPDRALFRRRVLVLDDRRDLAVGAAHDSPIAGRVIELDGQQRKNALLGALSDPTQGL